MPDKPENSAFKLLTSRKTLVMATSSKVMPKYVKRTMRWVADGAKKRRAVRTNDGHLSE